MEGGEVEQAAGDSRESEVQEVETGGGDAPETAGADGSNAFEMTEGESSRPHRDPEHEGFLALGSFDDVRKAVERGHRLDAALEQSRQYDKEREARESRPPEETEDDKATRSVIDRLYPDLARIGKHGAAIERIEKAERDRYIQRAGSELADFTKSVGLDIPDADLGEFLEAIYDRMSPKEQDAFFAGDSSVLIDGVKQAYGLGDARPVLSKYKIAADPSPHRAETEMLPKPGSGGNRLPSKPERPVPKNLDELMEQSRRIMAGGG